MNNYNSITDESLYYRVFVQNQDGALILQELCKRFYDRDPYVQGDTHETARRLGCRHVVSELLRKSAIVEG